MLEFVRTLVTTKNFIPHGHCYLWKAELVWLHVGSDSLTAIAYFSISFMLVYFVHQRRDVPFDWMFLMFGSFIVACGTTHLLEVWTLWHPTYWLSGLIKAITAWVSVGTAVLLVPLIPKALILPSPALLEVINLALRNEITQRQEAEQALQKANEQLEIRVGERTAELALINESLKAEIETRKRTEEALNRREQEFKALVEHAPDIIVRFDRDLRYVYVNLAIEVATGLPSTTFIGKTNRDLGMPKELVSEWDSVLRKVFETGQEGVMEFHFPTPSGMKYYQSRIAPEQVTGARVESILSIGRDITDRKLVEEALLRRTRQLEILSRASHQINRVLEIPTVMRTLIASAIELVGAVAGTYGLMRQARMIFTEYHEKGMLRPINVTFEQGIGVPGWVMETRQPYVSNDAKHDPHVLPHLQKAFSFYNLVNIPIFNRKGELIGCFEVHNKAEQRPFSDNDITMLQGLAASAAVALENAQMLVERQQAEEALRESEQRLGAIFNQAAVGIAQVGLDGKYLLVNQKLCDIFGYADEELLAQTVLDLTHPDDLSISMEYVRRMLAGEIQDYSMEKRYICKSACPVWVNLTSSIVRNCLGEPLYFISIVEDISDRKQTEEERQKLVSLIEDSSDFIGLAAMTGEVLYVNRAGKQLVGLDSNDEVKTTVLLDYLMEEDRAEYLEQIVSGLMQNGSWEGEYRFRHFKTDQPIVVHHNCFLIADSRTHEAIAIATMTRDITERKRIEQSLQENEAQMRLALEAANMGTWSVNLVTGSVTESELIGPMFGLPLGSANWNLDDWRSRVHPEDWEQVEAEFGEAIAGIANYDTQYRVIWADGTIRWLAVKGKILRDNTEKPLYAVGVAMDITDRKQSEEELQKSYNLLESVIEGTPDAILVKDLQGRYVMINSAVAKIQGKPESEILGRDDRELFGPEMGLPLMENDRRIITTGKTELLEENVPIGGTLRTYLSTKSVWRDAQGRVIGLIVISRDITHRKRAEQEIRELNQNLERRVAQRTAELEATNKELESFSYSVSHDLRAPLRGIDGFSQALLDRYADQIDDKGKHYLQRIRAGTQRMGELIDDLLKLSRVTRSEKQRRQVDLSALAREIAVELQRTQPERQVEWAIAPGLVANGDARLLRIVLENLLNNAWKFTSSHIQTRIEVDITLGDDAKSVYFVRDNGAGFDMAYVNKLFGAFQRLHSQTQFPGTGIGLATVQRIIHRHGGRVWAEGAVEQGATFYFTL